MPITYSRSGSPLREFEKEEVLREFWSPAVPGGDVEATNPVDPTIDPRLTRIPISVSPGGLVDVRFSGAGSIIEWILHDGTILDGIIETPVDYFVPYNGQMNTVYVRMKEGHTVAELSTLSYRSVYPSGYINAEGLTQIDASDLYYIRCSGLVWAQNTRIRGDASYLNDAVANASELYINNTYGERLYGDVSGWILKNSSSGRVLLYYVSTTGALQFHPDGLTKTITFMHTAFSSEDVSQTLVNWDAQSVAIFARTFYCNTIKRSQLTTDGEAAVVSLIAKGCAFTFKAE